jgi:hypothetical protein
MFKDCGSTQITLNVIPGSWGLGPILGAHNVGWHCQKRGSLLEVQGSWVKGIDHNRGCHGGLRDCCSNQDGVHFGGANVVEPLQEPLPPIFT